MKKIIIAQQMDIENFDYTMYYDELMAECDMFSAEGDRGYEFNVDLKRTIAKAFEDCNYDLEVIDEDEEMTEDEKNTERLVTIKYYFKSLSSAENGLTEEQFYNLGDLSRRYSNCASRDELDIICAALTILHNQEFVYGTIRGCCQGDWMEYICPKTINNGIRWIEAVLFGTGTEYRISIQEVEDDFDMTNAEKLQELIDADEEAFYDYTDLWKADNVKEWLAEGNSYRDLHFTKDDVVILAIKDSYTVKHYNYEVE